MAAGSGQVERRRRLSLAWDQGCHPPIGADIRITPGFTHQVSLGQVAGRSTSWAKRTWFRPFSLAT
ncbi:Hypothetical protein AJAP_06660 [Amycolatopsis japonica]|uniref:Uncharacterized protein n=1 Tax=Amycolatopsis japonica TaxID=208439 RepID=A0A075UNZ0_9PSEU|nr:Hypothetical protein AJAP_06660 [Amycolatopsis japonica]